MLKLRIVTALVLLAVVLPLLFYQEPVPFIVFALAMVSAATWEWGRMNGLSFRQAVVFGLMFAIVLAQFAYFSSFGDGWIWMPAGLMWLVGGSFLLWRGVSGWSLWPRWLRLVLGFICLAFAWLAMAQARMQGVNFLLSVFFLVWAADVCAYFGGRAFGRRKLAPTISPGKSWAGVYSGVIGVCLVALIWMWVDTRFPVDSMSLYTRLLGAHPVLGWLALGVLTGMSVVGDLVESLVKRSAGFKDSSQLLPGHGGVLDRIDALLPVLPLSMLIVSV